MPLIGIFILSNTASIKAADKPNKEVKAGIFNFEGYHSLNDQGGLEGYGIDLLSLLSEYSHLNFNLEGFDKSWNETLEMLKNGKIDIVSYVRRTPEREEDFIFSLPVGRNNIVLSTRLSNRKLKAGDYKTYKGMRVGVSKGRAGNEFLPEFAKDKGFNYTIVEYDNDNDLAEALQYGKVDAILSSNLRRPENETVLDIIKSQNFYIMARKEDQDIINEINHAIEQMNLNEGDWQNALFFKHYGSRDSGSLEYSARERAYIKDTNTNKRKIRATARMASPPYSYVEDGVLKGILPDYFTRLMQNARLPYSLVAPGSPDDYDELTTGNHVDVVLDLTEPDLVNEYEDFSGFYTEPYLFTGLAKVSRNDFKGPEKSIALLRNSPYTLRPGLTNNRELKFYSTPQEAMQAVKDGEVDVAYVLPLSAQIFINRNMDNDLFFTILDENGANYRLHVPAGADHELITILKKAIKRLPQGTINQLGSQYVSFNTGDVSLYQYLRAHPAITLTTAVAIMLVASMIALMWVHGRLSRRLLLTKEKANHELSEQLAIVEALSRDYANMLAINPDAATTSIIKIMDRKVADFAEDGEIVAYKRLVGNYIERKVHPEDRKYMSQALSLDNVLEKLKEKEEYSGTYRIFLNGETQYYQFTFVRPTGKSRKEDNIILAGFRNIDDVMRREQEQKRALEDALAKSRYASAAKTAFLNNMSHDIRTPMNAIIGFTTLASANADNVPLVRRYLDKIMTSGNHLLSLINDVLNMSRIESGKVKIKEEEVSLPEIFRDLSTIVQADIRSKKINFQMEAINVSAENIYCDKLRLNQVLLNVLSNAIKYTPAGGIVNVTLIQTSVVEEGKASYEFHVRDSGIGMSKGFLEHVFEPFEREQTTTVSGIEGTGLGLTITKNIVEMMGGTISVESELGKGSEFTVSFVFRVAQGSESDCINPKLEGRHILIINEDEKACVHLEFMLKKLGLNVDWTTSGSEGIVLAEKKLKENVPYDACLISWNLADKACPEDACLISWNQTEMTCVEVVEKLRAIIGEHTPIIILSPQDGIIKDEEWRKNKVDKICPRPIFISELKDLLSDHVKDKTAQKEQDRQDSFEGKRVLLVEDNEMNQEIAQMILEDAGMEVDIVENGQEAVDKMEEMPADSYELILMDVQMPVMNGYEATRAIRKFSDTVKAGIPIIAMTANAFDEDREEAIKSGMNGYVAKPIHIENLMNTLAEIMRNRSEAHL